MGEPSTESRPREPDGSSAPTAAPAKKPPAAAPGNELATPHEHAVATGNTVTLRETIRLRGGVPGERTGYSAAHAAAARLHGWQAHEYHANEPIRITREAYLAALEAASKPDDQGVYWPHAEALSPHAPAGTPDPAKRPKPTK